MDHAAHPQRPDRGGRTDAAKHVHQPGNGGAHRALQDPVCGMSVTEASTHKADHAGRSDWFCSTGRRTKFLTSPQKYLGPAAADPPASAAELAPAPSAA